MLTRFDHIVKNALGNLMSSQIPDWDVFKDILLTEENMPVLDETEEQDIGNVLHDLEYTGSLPAWAAFESRLDDFNAEMDAEFDQTIGDVMVNLPEASWKEQHWQMLSSRLDRLNDKPRLLMMKVIEAAAILLLLIQLTDLYSGYQQSKGNNLNLTTYIDRILNSNDQSVMEKNKEFVVPSNSFPSEKEGELNDKLSDNSNPVISGNNDSKNAEQSEVTIAAENQTSSTTDVSVNQGHIASDKVGENPIAGGVYFPVVTRLTTDRPINIPYNYLREIEVRSDFLANVQKYGTEVAPHLTNDPQLIDYDFDPNGLQKSSPKLGVRDISLLSTSSTDSILSSIPSLQVIRPRIHSSMEVGMLADATNVEIEDYVSLSGPYHEPTLNAGGYFRYKIQYQNIFGSLGADYLHMRYNGLSSDNEVSVVSLPVELGYNVVNLPSFRMYFSGGVAGRFVPLANYSTENFNQASSYGLRSNKPSNGLLNNGPFEINSYLAGRLSMGLDINVNKKTSINLRFSHDIWLKGRGIGYNLDKFRSSHLAIGTNFHL